MSATLRDHAPALPPATLAALEAIQRRVLWLATLMVHHANHVRPNPDGAKVGGHQASSASMATILTALYFHFLRPGDRVAVKPHASPAFHAVQYLLGRLPRTYLTTLRAYRGLQAYPSRTKDPDAVDFSTGSVGLGAVAPAFAALAHRYAKAHFGQVSSERFIALLGDAELDEGSVWEAVLEEALDGLENLIWVVDLNRQSLDRVIPGIRAARLKRLFEDNGWLVLEAKYGGALQARFARPGGAELRRRIDEMSNEEYQALIRLPGAELRARLAAAPGYDAAALAAALAETPDAALPGVIANLGGHDLQELLDVLGRAGSLPGRPTVIFAYTIKGWGLPIAGHPLNHSMLLSDEQIEALRDSLGIAPGREWDPFDPDTPEGQLCTEAARRLYGEAAADRGPRTDDAAGASSILSPHLVPDDLGVPAPETTSTQDAFGRILVRLADVPGLRERIVTASPDVSVSTNLAGWINKMGVFTPVEHPDYETEAYRLLRWRRGPGGRHIELGISEMNLFMLLGMFGLSTELCGQPLIPIGTVYDPFVCRGLDALIYGVYSGAKFIFAGTPSGVTLSPEGGAHQSAITPSIGAELPQLACYEPCFARELEWVMVDALRACLDRRGGHPTYLRLSTKPVEQRPFQDALRRLGEDALRRQALAGGYRLLDGREAAPEADPRYTVVIAAAGVMAPEALAAAAYLQREGVAASVLCLTSPKRLFERWQAARRAGDADPMPWLFRPEERRAPIVTVQDGASHSLAWLGGVHGAPVAALGVDEFGQSGARADLYRHFGIDATSIAAAAFDALDRFP
ncbi:MAG TPA: 1-deoxy-D-xylulose-5-phosphate synthase N-terminal domain-containing protein [Roseiflexaceae bacterium]|nr:1-deoxy-D-xylulose-5-phosphate synthase N-terminal domain-containing protein [Roseiflexaceae bacterium]